MAMVVLQILMSAAAPAPDRGLGWSVAGGLIAILLLGAAAAALAIALQAIRVSPPGPASEGKP
ncbi:hypothetical protein D3C83_320680 [compost metagenome]